MLRPQQDGIIVRQSGEIPALNGVRGLAILGVLFVHSYFGIAVVLPEHTRSWLEKIGEAGVFGVDLFFVLSGFLITSILLKRRNEPNYFRNFYVRRFLRLFPLYYGYLAFVAFILPAFHRLTHSTMQDYSGNWWWYVSYLSNWKPGHGAHDSFLGHFWSLALEEQFYLVWPTVVLFLSRRKLAASCFGIIAAATALRVALVFSGASWNAVYRLTVTRFDTLAYGALVALAMQSAQWRRRLLRWKGVAGWSAFAGFVLLCEYAGSSSWTEPSIQIASPVFTGIAFAALVAYAATRPSGFLTRPWLIKAGLYSYAAYVVHTVVFGYGINLEVLLLRYGAGNIQRLLLATAIFVLNWTVVFAIAALSRKYFEEPFLALKRKFESSPDPERVAVISTSKFA